MIKSALTLAQFVYGKIRQKDLRLCIIFMPRFEVAWRPDDLAFLHFLARAFVKEQSKILFVAGGEDLTPPPSFLEIKWLNEFQDHPPVESPGFGLLSLVPGIIDPAILQGMTTATLPGSNCVKLPNGHLLVAPEYRMKPTFSLRAEFDKLGILPNLPGAYQAFAQLYGNSYFYNPALLCAEAWKRFAEGAYDIAIILLQHVVKCTASLNIRGQFLWELQGMRIALQRFEEILEVPDPPDALPGDIKGGLLLMKGWALTILGEAKKGKDYLGKARELLKPGLEGSRQYTYTSNIFALSLFKSGDKAGALELEKQIESSLEQFAQANKRVDWPLTYVNSLNLARLYKANGDFKNALKYYQRGFDTTLGSRSESDAVYANLCLARLLGSQGLVTEAYTHWIKVCLHWISAQVPEALAIRVTASILRRKVDSYEWVVEEVSASLFKELKKAAGAAGHPIIENESLPAPVFRRIEYLDERWRNDACMIGSAGWSVLATKIKYQPIFTGPETGKLGRLLFSMICSGSVPAVSAGIATVLIDDNFKQEIPFTLHDMYYAVTRFQIPQLIFDGSIIGFTKAQRKALEMALSIKIGPACCTILDSGDGKVKIFFKRYFSPVILDGLEAKIIKKLDEPVTLEKLSEALLSESNYQTTLETISRLQAACVVKLFLDQDINLNKIMSE